MNSQLPISEFEISCDPSRMDLNMIHAYLSQQSYWAKGISFEKVKKSFENSLNFGVFHSGKQVGYARVISDFSTIAYLGDVFILDEFRRKGLSKLLMSEVMKHPELQGLRRWILLTADAHGLYRKFGWTEIASPARWMEKHDKEFFKY